MNISHTTFSGDFFSTTLLKKNLRHGYESRRRALSSKQISEKGRQVFERLLSLPFWKKANCVALYAAQAFEVPTAELFVALLKAQKHICFPSSAAFENASLALARSQDDLELDCHGIFCPKASCLPVAMADVELIVVPGVAFASNGARLGRGGGFYDRLLAHPEMKALRVGLCFEECLAENLPEETYDQRMHWVVTDSLCIDCS